ncbi:NADP-dependent oxidoreductase [Falsirhodobacter sp. 20TX0035]|uniref:NADP-dependent oxidoreductase n=1 Tax=Falsirhodobacter sp. 20TX0035 TaxID=3022019 RepID=UPI00232F1562|nr:NADP-dependent oxidoreductase [Falsirhodobacter sp. 20TX0035]MDB6455188.1 NADP-dependent oxidoreductase [Falsirhodobacter sp. 20TX0035]
MTQSTRIVLARRPEGRPDPSDFRTEIADLPALKDRDVLLETLYLSLDPYMRGRMSDARSYADPVQIGDVMVGATVSRVAQSRHGAWAEGDIVLSGNGWQTHAISDGTGLRKLDPKVASPSTALHVLGMTGFTAWSGLGNIGKPAQGETVVVAAASGPVGSMVGQIARLRGARAVGIAGGPEKCAYLLDELGFDAAVDHRAADFAERLAEACPDGIDVYFENVGGSVWDAVLPLLNKFARVPVCGLVAHYNDKGAGTGPDRLPATMGAVLSKSLTLRGFIMSEFMESQMPDFLKEASDWVAQGKLHWREDVVDGLEAAPEAFIGMLEGKNFGKLIVKVAEL